MNSSYIVVGRKAEYMNTKVGTWVDVEVGVSVEKVKSRSVKEHNKEVMEV